MGIDGSKLHETYPMKDYTQIGYPYQYNPISPIIENVFNFNTGEPISVENLHHILKSDIYFYHGTKFCSAIHIAKNGFDSYKGTVSSTGSRFGSGIYLSDNINTTFHFGSIIFVCTIHSKTIFESDTVASGETYKVMEQYNKENADAFYMKGFVDRHFTILTREFVQPATNFGEMVVKKGKDIRIHYVIELSKINVMNINLNCIYDYKLEIIKEKAQLTDINNIFYGENLFSVDINLSAVMKLLNYGVSKFIDKNGNIRVYHKEITSKDFKKNPTATPGYKIFVDVYDTIDGVQKIDPRFMTQDVYYADVKYIVYID